MAKRRAAWRGGAPRFHRFPPKIVALRCVALRCAAPRRVALRCGAVLVAFPEKKSLRCGARRSGAGRRVALRCGAWRCVAARGAAARHLLPSPKRNRCVAVRGEAARCGAVRRETRCLPRKEIVALRCVAARRVATRRGAVRSVAMSCLASTSMLCLLVPGSRNHALRVHPHPRDIGLSLE